MLLLRRVLNSPRQSWIQCARSFGDLVRLACSGRQTLRGRFSAAGRSGIAKVLDLRSGVPGEDSIRRFLEEVVEHAGIEEARKGIHQSYGWFWTGMSQMRPGNVGSCAGWEGVAETMLQALGPDHGIVLVRGDIGFSGDKNLSWVEQRKSVHYLYKLRQTRLVQQAARALRDDDWVGSTFPGLNRSPKCGSNAPAGRRIGAWYSVDTL